MPQEGEKEKRDSKVSSNLINTEDSESCAERQDEVVLSSCLLYNHSECSSQHFVIVACPFATPDVTDMENLESPIGKNTGATLLQKGKAKPTAVRALDRAILSILA